MIRVVHSLPVWLPATSPWLYNQVRLLPAETVQAVVAAERIDNFDQYGLPTIRPYASRPLFARAVDRLLRRSRARRYEAHLVAVGRATNATILHSHWGDAGWHDLRAARRLHAAHIVSFYGKEVNFLPTQQPVWRARYRELFERADCILSLGPHMSGMLAQLGCPPGKIRVHPLGVETGSIAYRPRTWRPDEPLRVLLAASFREKKGLPYALQALGRVRTEVAKLEVTIVGDASADPRSVPEKAKILAAIRDGGLEPGVRLLGYQPYTRLLEEAYAHHIFMSPSVTAADGDTEGTPMTLVDMAATGIPVISTFHSDIPTIVLDGETGLLAAERDVDGLIAHLRRLIGDPTQWRPMLDAARRHVEEHFDAARQSRRLAALYEDLAVAGAAVS